MRNNIRFINTFIPVVHLYENIFPGLVESGYRAVALISQGVYRAGADESDTGEGIFDCERIWVPFRLRHKKRWCAFFFWCQAPFRLLFSPAAVNIFLTQPPLFFIWGPLVSRFNGTPFILYIMDLYPDILERRGILSADNFFYRLFSRVAANAMLKAKAIIVIGRCTKNLLIGRGIKANKIFYVPNWAERTINPLEKKANFFVKKYGLEDKFIVMYSGNMGLAHEFDTLLEVARRLENNSNVVFLFIGSGSQRKKIQKTAVGLSNVLMLDYQPLEVLQNSLSAADVHFVSLKEGFEGTLVPSKYYGILAAGRPVIYEGHENGEIALSIKESGCGAVIKSKDVDGLYDKISFYFDNREVTAAEGRLARMTYENKYSSEKSAALVVSSILAAVGSNSMRKYYELFTRQPGS